MSKLFLCGANISTKDRDFCDKVYRICRRCGDYLDLCFTDHHEPNCTRVCRETDCKPLPDLQNGYHNGSRESSVYGTIVEFNCNKWYRMVGESHITCDNFSKWSNSMPVCDLIDAEKKIYIGIIITLVILGIIFVMFKIYRYLRTKCEKHIPTDEDDGESFRLSDFENAGSQSQPEPPPQSSNGNVPHDRDEMTRLMLYPHAASDDMSFQQPQAGCQPQPQPQPQLPTQSSNGNVPLDPDETTRLVPYPHAASDDMSAQQPQAGCQPQPQPQSQPPPQSSNGNVPHDPDATTRLVPYPHAASDEMSAQQPQANTGQTQQYHVQGQSRGGGDTVQSVTTYAVKETDRGGTVQIHIKPHEPRAVTQNDHTEASGWLNHSRHQQERQKEGKKITPGTGVFDIDDIP